MEKQPPSETPVPEEMDKWTQDPTIAELDAWATEQNAIERVSKQKRHRVLIAFAERMKIDWRKEGLARAEIMMEEERQRHVDRNTREEQGWVNAKEVVEESQKALKGVLIAALKQLAYASPDKYFRGQQFLYDKACKDFLDNIPVAVQDFLDEVKWPGPPPKQDSPRPSLRTLKEHTNELETWTRNECDAEMAKSDDPDVLRYRAERLKHRPPKD